MTNKKDLGIKISDLIDISTGEPKKEIVDVRELPSMKSKDKRPIDDNNIVFLSDLGLK